MITLFHGSDKIIERPYYGGSRDNNDYGNGFCRQPFEAVVKDIIPGQGRT